MIGTWQGLANQPPFVTSTMILLTDGRVMVQEEATAHWHALTPDAFGSYENGTWSSLADMSFWRRYYASAMLRDGRVIVIGGEQSGDGGDTNKGEIYDPVSNSWSPIPSPLGWADVGDAVCCLFPDGRLMIGALPTPDCTIYDPTTDSWAAAASKAVRSNEETWILLPDESILTVQCWDPWESERYSISSNAWKNEGKLPVPLVDPVMHEIGPAMLLYDGRVIYFGAANAHGRGRTAIYTPPATQAGTGTWARGPGPTARRQEAGRVQRLPGKPDAERKGVVHRGAVGVQRLGIADLPLRVRPLPELDRSGADAAQQRPTTLLESHDAPADGTGPVRPEPHRTSSATPPTAGRTRPGVRRSGTSPRTASTERSTTTCYRASS